MSPSVSVRLLLTQSDDRLVELARAGHERAFEALVLRYRRPLLGYCRRLLLPNERAEDALQQGLLQAWLALQGGTEVHDVKPWLYRIVHNAALNMLRRSGYDYSELSETLTGAGAPTEDLDRRIAVREALAGLAALPEMQREALLRTAVDGSSYQQAAANMGLSEPALRGLVHRARTTLRAAATALTPSPLLSWALVNSGGAGDAPLVSRLAETGAGGGSLGLAGLLAKAGATTVTAGVLVGGISVFHHSHHLGSGTHNALSAKAVAHSRAAQAGGGRELVATQSPTGARLANAPTQVHLVPHPAGRTGVPRARGEAHRRMRRHLSLEPGPPLATRHAPTPTGQLAGPAPHPKAEGTGGRTRGGTSGGTDGGGAHGGGAHDGVTRGGSGSHDGAGASKGGQQGTSSHDGEGTSDGRDGSGGSPDRQPSPARQPSSEQPSSGPGESSGSSGGSSGSSGGDESSSGGGRPSGGDGGTQGSGPGESGLVRSDGRSLHTATQP